MGRRAELLHGHTASRHPVYSWLSSLLGSLEGWQGLPSTCSHHPPLSMQNQMLSGRCCCRGGVPLLRQPEPHHHPWDTPISPLGSPWAAQVMIVPCGITGLPWCLMTQLSTALGAVCTPQTPWGRITMLPPGKVGTHRAWHCWVWLSPVARVCTESRSICHQHPP